MRREASKHVSIRLFQSLGHWGVASIRKAIRTRKIVGNGYLCIMAQKGWAIIPWGGFKERRAWWVKASIKGVCSWFTESSIHIQVRIYLFDNRLVLIHSPCALHCPRGTWSSGLWSQIHLLKELNIIRPNNDDKRARIHNTMLKLKYGTHQSGKLTKTNEACGMHDSSQTHNFKYNDNHRSTKNWVELQNWCAKRRWLKRLQTSKGS